MTRFKKWFPWLRKPDYSAELNEAKEELSNAQASLRKSKLEQHHAHQLVRTMQHIREKNHFGEAIERAYKHHA